jgi:phosphoglucosamine mutase
VLLLAARDLQRRGGLNQQKVVATTMSNMGLEAALRGDGISMLRAPVGDRYVLAWMKEHRASLGGEQSGHILFPALSTTGDGLLTALVVLDVIRREEFVTITDTIRAAEAELKDNGRVVVRYSGTESLARVMIEAESQSLMQFHAERIAGAIREELGVVSDG